VNKVVPYSTIYLGVGIGILLSILVAKSTKANETPSWFWVLSFVGFFVALNWIFLLANEVVGLLQVRKQNAD
jgi:sodium/potassium/calcium exchanger 6